MIISIQKVQQQLPKNKIDALLVSSAYNIGYLTGFFGFSKSEREGYLLVTQQHCYIFSSGLNSTAVKKHIDGTDIQLVEISPRTPLTKKALANVIKHQKIKRLGFEKHNLLFSEYERLQKDVKVILVPTKHIIEDLRMIKSQQEINAIEKACTLGDNAFDYVRTKIKAGVTEKDLAFEIENYFRQHRYEPSFPSIVAFGENAAIPHHVTSNQRLIDNSWVLLDFGVVVDNYCSDMTRTVFFGKVTVEQKRMYNAVLDSQTKAIDFLTSSLQPLVSDNKQIKAKNVDTLARSHIVSQGYPTIPHSLGHGIGLEVHEPPKLSPKSKNVLKPNMVFSIEPGIYLPASTDSRTSRCGPDVGGVRIEDLVVLTSSTPRYLTKAKRDLIEV